MMLAIHNNKDSFSNRWIQYCKNNQIPYKKVDCFQSDIMEQLKDCNGLMWNWNLTNPKIQFISRQLCSSLETVGKKMFPDYKTSWHYDDKVGQKYLLESVNAPLVPSYVFFNKQDALDWADQTTFPKVFKLRGGAGSSNVKLISSRHQAVSHISRSFNKGFKSSPCYTYDFKKKIQNTKTLKKILQKIRRLPKSLINIHKINKNHTLETGYVYFQDFIPDNSFDIRIIVIGKRAFGIKRMVRPNDFRASGSGHIIYDPAQIDTRCIDLSFQTANQLDTQCLAFDYVFLNNTPLIIEVSYDFSILPYDTCPGFWDQKLNWYNGSFNPQNFMIEDFINKLNEIQ